MDSTNKDLSHSINCSHCSFNRLIPAICNDRICNADKLISISQYGGILQITLGGFVEVTSKFLERMKKSGFVFKSIHNLIDPESLSQDLEIQDEDDVPTFVWTIIRFKDTELPPLENDDGKNDNEVIAIDKQTMNIEQEDKDLEIQGRVNN